NIMFHMSNRVATRTNDGGLKVDGLMIDPTASLVPISTFYYSKDPKDWAQLRINYSLELPFPKVMKQRIGNQCLEARTHEGRRKCGISIMRGDPVCTELVNIEDSLASGGEEEDNVQEFEGKNELKETLDSGIQKKDKHLGSPPNK
ncbi:hypothetical protein KI387_024841, partial [Taxus chinensis]